MIVKYKLKQPAIVSERNRKIYPSGTIVIVITNHKNGQVTAENVNTKIRFVTTEDNLTEI